MWDVAIGISGGDTSDVSTETHTDDTEIGNIVGELADENVYELGNDFSTLGRISEALSVHAGTGAPVNSDYIHVLSVQVS